MHFWTENKKDEICANRTSNAHKNKTPITPNFWLFLSLILSNVNCQRSNSNKIPKIFNYFIMFRMWIWMPPSENEELVYYFTQISFCLGLFHSQWNGIASFTVNTIIPRNSKINAKLRPLSTQHKVSTSMQLFHESRINRFIIYFFFLFLMRKML